MEEKKEVIVIGGGRQEGKTAALKAMKENKVTLEGKNPNAEYPAVEPTTVEVGEPAPQQNVEDIVAGMKAKAKAAWKKLTPEKKAEIKAEQAAKDRHNKALKNGNKSYARTKGFKPVPHMLSIHNYGRKYGKTSTDFIIM